MQERIAAPLTMTVQAPHCPSPQPNFGPCSPRSLRRMYNSGVEGSTSTVCEAPFTFRVMLLMQSAPESLTIGSVRREIKEEVRLKPDTTSVAGVRLWPDPCVVVASGFSRTECDRSKIHAAS